MDCPKHVDGKGTFFMAGKLLTLERSFGFVTLMLILLPVAHAQEGNASAAAAWLESHQSQDGSWVMVTPLGTNRWLPLSTLPVSALHSFEGKSNSTDRGLTYLSSSVNGLREWQTGESTGDIAGSLAYAFGSTGHATLLNNTNLSARLLSFQGSDGGIKGWLDCRWNGTACEGSNAFTGDASDTSWTVLGLSTVNGIPSSNLTAALVFLARLQNTDGSVNLTSHEASNALEGMAPDIESTTSLAFLAFSVNESHSRPATLALSFLKSRARTCFTGNTASYSLSLMAWAYSVANDSFDAAYAFHALSLLQNDSGGFADSRRTTFPAPNSLDTGIALHAFAHAPHSPGGAISPCMPSPLQLSENTSSPESISPGWPGARVPPASPPFSLPSQSVPILGGLVLLLIILLFNATGRRI